MLILHFLVKTCTASWTNVLPDVPEGDREVLCCVVGCLYVEEQPLEGVGEALLELHSSNQDKTNSHSITNNWKMIYTQKKNNINNHHE